jgi:4-hydroxy-2-oxoheptanedioate aldolase
MPSSDEPMSSLRDRWRAGNPTFGAWCTIPSTWTAELAARSGHDWVCIDTQHGLIGYDLMLPMLQAITAGGVPSFVRVPWNEPGTIMKALDAGAAGVIVPMVNSVEEARSAVGACRYPPDGFRSMGPTRARVVDGDWRHPICAVMIETVQAVERVDDILAVPGIDAVFIGPNDLAVSVGVDSSYGGRDPEHRRMIETVSRSCKAHGVTAGIMCGTPEVAIQWHRAGFQMLALGSDTTLLAEATHEVIERAKKLAQSTDE